MGRMLTAVCSWLHSHGLRCEGVCKLLQSTTRQIADWVAVAHVVTEPHAQGSLRQERSQRLVDQSASSRARPAASAKAHAGIDVQATQNCLLLVVITKWEADNP